MKLFGHIFAALFLMVAVAWIRIAFEAYRALSKAQTALEAGDLKAAIIMYREAIAWSAPLNPWSSAARVELEQIINNWLEGKEDKISALWEYRRGLSLARSFLSASNGDLAKIDEIDAEIRRLEIERGNAQQIFETYPPRVNFFAQIVTQMFFWSWVGCCVLTVLCGFTVDGKALKGPLLKGSLATLGFFVCWLTALSW